MVLGAVCAAGAAAAGGPDVLAATGDAALRFGLTPVFLDSDTDLLAALERYLSSGLERPVVLIKRRTYQEITTLLMTGQLDAAWICGFPYVQFRSQLALVAVPLYRSQPFYQSYVIVPDAGSQSAGGAGRNAG
jgi:phosphonate transport system substrate-binding protein